MPSAITASVVHLQTVLSTVAGDQALRHKLQAAAGVGDVVTLAQAPNHALSGNNSLGNVLMQCFGAGEAD